MNDFQYAYPFASVIEEGTAHQKNFIFSHCSELKEDNAVPCFFWGNITQPFVVAKCLATLAKTVSIRYCPRGVGQAARPYHISREPTAAF